MIRRLGLATLTACAATWVAAAPPAFPDDGDLARQQAIRKYEELLAGDAMAGRRDEIRIRLGVLHLDRADEMAAAGRAKMAEGSRRAALKQFETILDSRVSMYREDAEFYRALTLLDLGRKREGTQALAAFAKENPGGTRTAEVAYRRGQLAVEDNRLKDALGLFETTARHGSPRWRERGRYMEAWTLSALGRKAAARDTAQALLVATESDPGDPAVRAEAMQLLAEIVRDLGDPAALAGPWPGPRPSFVEPVLRRAADLAAETAAFGLAASILERLGREHASGADRDVLERRALEAYAQAGDEAVTHAARERRIARIGAGSERSTLVAASARHLDAEAKAGRAPWRDAIAAAERAIGEMPAGRSRDELRLDLAEARAASGDLPGADRDLADLAATATGELAEGAAYRRLVLLEEAGAPVDAIVRAHDDYLARHAASPRANELRFRALAHLFDAGRHDALLRRAPREVPAFGDRVQQARAEVLAGRAAAALRRPQDVQTWALRALVAGADRETLATAKDLHASALFELGASGATDPYVELADRYPSDARAPAALYNAAIALRERGDVARAAALLDRVIAKYPRADVAADARGLAVTLRRDSGDFSAAADLLASQAAAEPSQHRRRQLWLEAGLEAKRANDPDRARQFFASALEGQTPRDSVALLARVELARAAIAVGRLQPAATTLEAAIARAPRSPSEADQAALADAHAMRGELSARNFDAIALTPPLDRSLGRKQRALEESLAALEKAAEFGFADSAIPSLELAARLQHDFAAALWEAPRPSGMTADDEREYEGLLREQIAPFVAGGDRARQLAEAKARAAGRELAAAPERRELASRRPARAPAPAENPAPLSAVAAAPAPSAPSAPSRDFAAPANDGGRPTDGGLRRVRPRTTETQVANTDPTSTFDETSPGDFEASALPENEAEIETSTSSSPLRRVPQGWRNRSAATPAAPTTAAPAAAPAPAPPAPPTIAAPGGLRAVPRHRRLH